MGRDSLGIEPPHYSRPNVPSEKECGRYCNYPECNGFPYCTDKCAGLCLLYVTSAIPPPGNGSEWTFINSTGNACDIKKVTKEEWWRCYTKSSLKDSKIMQLNAKPTPGQGCLYNGKKEYSTTHAQQNFVITVPTINGDMLYIGTGDRWQQAPDGIK